MNIKERKIVLLVLENGKVPFEVWHNRLSPALQRAVDARLSRLSAGNFGDHKSIGDGLFELRIMKGPGLRIYYGLTGTDLVILVAAGDKASQNKDIQRAKFIWRKYCEN